MEIEKLLDTIPYCVYGNETLYNAFAFEKRLHEQEAYSEAKDVIITPFYIEPNMRWRYEIYEYELNIIISDDTTFERFARRFFPTSDLENVDAKLLDRLKKRYIGAKKGDNILLPLQKYMSYILRGKEIRSDYDEYFGGYHEENVFLSVFW